MLNNVQNVAISENATLSVVHRDQYNQTTINRIVHVGRPGRTFVKRGRKKYNSGTEYDQYREVIRGDIHKLEQLSSQDVWDWEWKDGNLVQTYSYRKTIHQAQVYGDDRVFTAISYHGRDAEKFWKKDFVKCCQADDPAVLVQLFGINRSKVPTLLFYDDWLPLGCFHDKLSETFWEKFYLAVYSDAWWRRIDNSSHLFGSPWLNSRTGRISPGPDGLSTLFISTRVLYNYEDMPSVMEMANADTCFKFFNKTGAGNLDLDVVQYAYYRYASMTIQGLLGITSVNCRNHTLHDRFTKEGSYSSWRCNRYSHIECDEARVQDFVGKLRWNTVYSGAQLEEITFVKEGLVGSWKINSERDGTLIDSGLTRFQFDDEQLRHGLSVFFSTRVVGEAWLSQAHRSDLTTYEPGTCFIPDLYCSGHSVSRHKGSDVSTLKLPSSVYLFLRPPPPSLADIDSWWIQVSFWSFDANGTCKIPEAECKRMGLPNVALNYVNVRLQKWSKYVYDAIHAWQVARGFDPTTTDFARSLSLPIFEPGTTRFEDIFEEESAPIVDSLAPQVSTSDETVSEKEEPASSSTGSWWSWTAIPQSDISAFAV
ncbi:hypothetical protein Moror_16805 [Moniliophthora roreri MCA 2997]|uniref:Uncharacterized protein n=2 Tax=Moniliophthora roreri TaxID=221103 RepID=V2X7R4_MONRO|nr:hypothetical protein Moror_16805 [Moniliophthora roreri MCA 2997]